MQALHVHKQVPPGGGLVRAEGTRLLHPRMNVDVSTKLSFRLEGLFTVFAGKPHVLFRMVVLDVLPKAKHLLTAYVTGVFLLFPMALFDVPFHVEDMFFTNGTRLRHRPVVRLEVLVEIRLVSEALGAYVTSEGQLPEVDWHVGDLVLFQDTHERENPGAGLTGTRGL